MSPKITLSPKIVNTKPTSFSIRAKILFKGPDIVALARLAVPLTSAFLTTALRLFKFIGRPAICSLLLGVFASGTSRIHPKTILRSRTLKISPGSPKTQISVK